MITIFSEQNLKIDFADVEYFSDSDYIFCDIALIIQGFNLENIKIFAEIVILCGDGDDLLLDNIFCEKIITYGLSSKNSVTISSHCDDEILLAIQREFYSIHGAEISIGEVAINPVYNRVIDDLAVNVLKIVLSKKLP